MNVAKSFQIIEAAHESSLMMSKAQHRSIEQAMHEVRQYIAYLQNELGDLKSKLDAKEGKENVSIAEGSP